MLTNKKLSNNEVEQQRSSPTKKFTNKEVHQQEVHQQEVHQQGSWATGSWAIVGELLVGELPVGELLCWWTSLLVNFLLVNFLLVNFLVGELPCCSTSCWWTSLLVNFLLVNIRLVNYILVNFLLVNIGEWKKSHLSLAPSFQKRSQPSSSISCHLFTFICKQCLVNWALTWLCFCLYQLLKGDSLSQDLHQPLLVLPWPPSPPSRARRSRSTCLQHPLSERDQCILSTKRAYLGFHLESIFATTLVCFASFFLGRFAFGLYILVWSAAWREGHSEQIVQQTEQSVSVCWQISDRHTDQWENYPADYVDNEKMLNHIMINDMVMLQSMSIAVVIISSINKILIVISSHLVALLRDIAKYHMLN